MVLGSLSPLFILWAIRGNRLIEGTLFTVICLIFAVLPNAFLYYRIRKAIKRRDSRIIVIENFDDNQTQLIAYLFSILLPFYRQEFETIRDLIALSAALFVIIFLFYKLNILHVNPLFILFGYRIYTIKPASNNNPYSGNNSLLLVTWRKKLYPTDRVQVIRIRNSVYLERRI